MKITFPVTAGTIPALTNKLNTEFDALLPGGQYFDVLPSPDGNSVRIGIMEEAGGCTVTDWRIDSADLRADGVFDASAVKSPALLAALQWITG